MAPLLLLDSIVNPTFVVWQRVIFFRDRQIDRSNILGNIPSKFGKMDIANKTRCYRSSKRFDLFSGQWEAKRLENHRKKVEYAGPRTDVQTPKSANFQHVKVPHCIIGFLKSFNIFRFR